MLICITFSSEPILFDYYYHYSLTIIFPLCHINKTKYALTSYDI